MAFAIGGGPGGPIHQSLQALTAHADQISMAVAFVQPGGWRWLKRNNVLSPAQINSLRVICDDKMGLTNPQAIHEMLADGVNVRAYSGPEIYHPKLYLTRRADHVDEFIIGSANLSEPALTTSVEAVWRGQDPSGHLGNWFDNLFHAQSADFDAARLARLQQRFNARARGDLAALKAGIVAAPQAPSIPPSSADLVDRLFSGLGPYVAPLSFDQGKNNVRSLSKAWELTKKAPGQWSDVQEDELRFSGLADSWTLTALGSMVAAETSIADVVTDWITWLKHTPEAALPARRFHNLSVARRAFAKFWKMQPEVREYFLNDATLSNPPDRATLQAIELLANAGDVATSLTLEEVKELAPLLTSALSFPPQVAGAVRTYLENKATRTWGLPERRLLLEAWRDIP